MTYSIKREPNSNLLILLVEIDTIFELRMILDTGASHTTIDSNALHLLGYDLSDSVGTVEIETANGIIQTDVFEVTTFKSIGIEKNNFQIQVYDFLAHSIFSDYNGLLGLDFLEGLNFCIKTRENEISVT
jgi:predicted aspartyl protease